MKNIALLFCAAMLLLGAGSCKKNPVEPPFPDDGGLTPGSRNYTWVADTIKNPYIYLRSIWGNSVDNIWTTGDLMSDAIFKYNGHSWNLDARVYINSPQGIWGYNNCIWISNDKGSIWMFTDNNYTQQLKDFRINGGLTSFGNMAGSSNNEIYAIGSVLLNNANYPIILKFDGNSWTLDKRLNNPGGLSQIKYSSKNNKYYMVSNQPDYTVNVYEYDRQDLKLIYDSQPTNAGPTIAQIDGYSFIVIENKVYRYFNSRMENILEVDDSKFGGVVWGRNRNDIFIRMLDGLAHYNGTDIEYLFKTSGSTMMAPNMAIFDKDVFVNVKDYNTGYNMIYHGTLK